MINVQCKIYNVKYLEKKIVKDKNYDQNEEKNHHQINKE